MATKKFKCTVCGYIHEGDSAPEACPVCKAPASAFVELKAEKKGTSTNSNAYTLIYAAVMVIIVAFLLSFVSSSLKERQDKNIELDKMKQILSAINIYDVLDAQAEYLKYVKFDIIIDGEGNTVAESGAFTLTGKQITDDYLPVYVCDVDGSTKYVIPMTGNGLWGAIWGYIALDENKSTVYGIYFNHASETPGLGAEIVAPQFTEPFIGKNIMRDGSVTSIAVVKAGKSVATSDYVDGISGGTITSDAVNDMLKTCLNKYDKFLTKE